MKKINIKSIIIGFMAGGVFISGVMAATLAKGDVYINKYPINLNGKEYTATLPLLNYQNRTYVPLNELASMSGSEVTFKDSTIYINSTKNTNSSNKNNTKSIEVKIDENVNAYIDLSYYNAKSAKLVYVGNNIKLSRDNITMSGNVVVTGQREGSTIIQIIYDTGDVDYIYTTIKASNTYDEMKVESGDYEYIDIDLDEYDADEADLSVTEGGSYIILEKTSITKSGKIKVTGKKEGVATVKVLFDSGRVLYVTVKVEDDEYYDKLEMETDDYEYLKIDLEDYDAKRATLSITDGSEYITLGKTTLTTTGKVKVTGEAEGEATIKIKFDSGDTEYAYVEVEEGDYSYKDYKNYLDELSIDKGDYEYIDIDLEDYDADEAILSIISGRDYITLEDTEVTKSGRIKVNGKRIGESIIKIRFDSGDIEYVYTEVE